MKIKISVFIFLLPFLVFACNTIKPVSDLTDVELADEYDNIDLRIYMIKNPARSNSSSTGYTNNSVNSENKLSKKDIEKKHKLENRLETIKQELIKRGYIP